MRSPRPLRFVVGTTLLALGGCTSSAEKIHVNPGPEERESKTTVPETPRPEPDTNPGRVEDPEPEPPHVNEGRVDETKKLDPKVDPDGDGRPNFAINPGPKDPKPGVDDDPLAVPKKDPPPKHVNTGPK